MKIVYITLIGIVLLIVIYVIYSKVRYDIWALKPEWDIFVDILSHIWFGFVIYGFVRISNPKLSQMSSFTITMIIGFAYEIVEITFFYNFPTIIDLEWRLDNMFMDLFDNMVGALISVYIEKNLYKKKKEFL
jgi:glycopeptide antibiotics resistance protein